MYEEPSDSYKSGFYGTKTFKAIFEIGVSEKDDNKSEIVISALNPLVLAAFCQIMNQSKYLVHEKKNLEETTFNLYSSILLEKAIRYYKDITILYNKEFYKIVGFDKESRLIAKIENRLGSIEKIYATRLFEKIAVCYEKNKEKNRNHSENRKLKVLLFGEVDGLDELKKRLKENKYHIDIYQRDGKILKEKTKLKEEIESHDLTFILDCPELYDEITIEEENDRNETLVKNERVFKQPLNRFLDYNNHLKRPFAQGDSFSNLVYKMQTKLIIPNSVNATKHRKINEKLLDEIDEFLKHCEKKDEEKICLAVYVYISNNRDFKNSYYDTYNFARLERFNAKKVRIIRFLCEEKNSTKRLPLKKDSGRELKTNLYKLIKPLENTVKKESDGKIEIFGKKVSYDAALNTAIKIKYSAFRTGGTEIEYSINSKSTDTEKIAKFILEEAFCEYATPEKDAIHYLRYCFKKSFAISMMSSIKNFHDALFMHWYFQHLKGNPNLAKWNTREVASEDKKEKGKLEYSEFKYSQVGTVLEMFTLFDSDASDLFTADSSYYHLLRMNHKKEKTLDNRFYYLEAAALTCADLEYIDTRLFKRLAKFI